MFRGGKVSRFLRMERQSRKFYAGKFLEKWRYSSTASSILTPKEKKVPVFHCQLSLSQVIPLIVIKEANDSVCNAVKLQGKRNPYLKSVTPKKKAEIAKYAAENGILASIRHFSKEFPDNTLKESTVRGWKVTYRIKRIDQEEQRVQRSRSDGFTGRNR